MAVWHRVHDSQYPSSTPCNDPSFTIMPGSSTSGSRIPYFVSHKSLCTFACDVSWHCPWQIFFMVPIVSSHIGSLVQIEVLRTFIVDDHLEGHIVLKGLYGF